MSSFMCKKKKYKFQVEICLEHLLEVPFVSAVLFAKLRLLDGGNFQDHSSRQEVRDHKVNWDAKFSFPCKMMANASTGVMEKCILRISIRKECKGGRSFTKLGFVDLNLAEYAGAGSIHKKALLEGYDARHRQDNSMLKFRIQLNMISGDILFKAPSPSLQHKQLPMEESATDNQRTDEFSSGSLAGSINSGSSGFGSLPKRRTPLPSELFIGQTLSESNQLPSTTVTPSEDVVSTLPLVVAPATADVEQHHHILHHQQQQQELSTGHSRNSSNTSQMSKASGYSSISHSRQSSSGDSATGHVRNNLQHDSLRKPISNKFLRTNTFPKHRLNIPTTILSETPPPPLKIIDFDLSNHHSDELFHTPKSEFSTSNSTSASASSSTTPKSADNTIFYTPTNIFDKNFNSLQKSASSSVVERLRWNPSSSSSASSSTTANNNNNNNNNDDNLKIIINDDATEYRRKNGNISKSDFIIPKLSPIRPKSDRTLSNVITSFLTPRLSRKATQSNPFTSLSSSNNNYNNNNNNPLSMEETRAVSMGNLKFNQDGHLLMGHGYDGSRNPSSTSIPSSTNCCDTGSLDRVKNVYERRKKNLNGTDDTGSGGTSGGVSGRVEGTRVKAEDFIADLLKSTNLEPSDDSAETSGLQLFIAKDGTASLGSHEVKSQMSTGIKTFKQVVMDDNRKLYQVHNDSDS